MHLKCWINQALGRCRDEQSIFEQHLIFLLSRGIEESIREKLLSILQLWPERITFALPLRRLGQKEGGRTGIRPKEFWDFEKKLKNIWHNRERFLPLHSQSQGRGHEEWKAGRKKGVRAERRAAENRRKGGQKNFKINLAESKKLFTFALPIATKGKTRKVRGSNAH